MENAQVGFQNRMIFSYFREVFFGRNEVCQIHPNLHIIFSTFCFFSFETRKISHLNKKILMLTSNSENHFKKYSSFCSEKHPENPKPQNSVTFGRIVANQKPSFKPSQSQHNSIPTNSNPTHPIKGNFFQMLQFQKLILLRNFCFVHPIFGFWFLVTFGDKVTKIG